MKELDIREWGDFCPRLEDHEGEDPEETYNRRVKLEEEAKKGKEKNTLMDDEIFGDGDDSDDETYGISGDSGVEEFSSDEDMSANGSDDEEFNDVQIDSDEVELLGPLQPYPHHDCVGFRCPNHKYFDFNRAGRDFGTYEWILKIWC